MKIDWTQFKNFVGKRKVDILMLEDSYFYYLHSCENDVAIECEIDKYPSDTTILDDFEDNYLALCNPEKIEVVIPSTPLNDHEMKPYGLCHDHIDSSDNHIYSITLSNKSGNDYTYSCTITPVEYDYISTSNGNIFDEVEEVDTQNNTLETFEGRHSNGDYSLIKPHVIDFKFPSTYQLYQLWECYAHVEDFGKDDHVCLQIVDVDNVLGGGSNVVLKEYDEVWCSILYKLEDAIRSPDGAPGDIVGGLYARVLYYPKDVTKTDVKFLD